MSSNQCRMTCLKIIYMGIGIDWHYSMHKHMKVACCPVQNSELSEVAPPITAFLVLKKSE